MNQQQFDRMYNALVTISKGYQTPDELRKNSKKGYGLSYDESITMAYENIQATAKLAIKGIRKAKLKPVIDSTQTK